MVREMPSTRDGAQPEDPATVSRVMLAALDAEQSPFGLPLGAGGVDAIAVHLDAVRF